MTGIVIRLKVAIVDAPEPLDEAELRAHLAERLVRSKLPRTIEFVTSPLRDDAGKVRRSALRDADVSADDMRLGCIRNP